MSGTQKRRQYKESHRDKIGFGTNQRATMIAGDPHKPGGFRPVPWGSERIQLCFLTLPLNFNVFEFLLWHFTI